MVLPEPEPPMMATTLPARKAHVDALVQQAIAIGEGEIVDFDNVVVHGVFIAAFINRAF